MPPLASLLSVISIVQSPSLFACFQVVDGEADLRARQRSARVLNATFGKVLRTHELVSSCRTGFFLSLSINKATPPLATQPHEGQVQGRQGGREGGAGGASRYPAQGGAKGGRWDKTVQAVAACRRAALKASRQSR